MGHYTVAILLALSALTFTSAFHKLVPSGKELVYDYKALVKAGTIIPASYASEFYLHGKLHVQHTDSSAFVQLSDLKYKVYNGERYYGHEYDIEEMVVPKEAEDLLKPFKIAYNTNGQVKGIVTDKQEKMYARNMHKAIAAMLQMDVEKVHLDSDKAHAFMTEEYSIYGKTVAAYNVLPKTDKMVVQKMHEMKSTRPMYHAMITNILPTYCEAHYEEPMSHDSHQYYVIVKKDGHHVVKHLESTGGIYIYPFQAKSEAEYVFVNVTLNLQDIVPVAKAFQVASEHTDEDLTYRIIDPSVETVMPDIMNGRRVMDVQKYVPIVENMLTEMGEWLHKDHLHMAQPDIEHGQLINRLVRLFTIFDYDTLEKMYATFYGKTTDEGKNHLEIIHQILPLVGTHASVTLIKNIIHEKKVDDHIAMHMLHTLPSHVRVPTEKMLQDMEDMLTWEKDVHVNIHSAAVLCFASLVQRTFYIQKTIAQGHQHHHLKLHHDTMSEDREHVHLHVKGMHHPYDTEDVKKFINEHPIYNKYVTDFFIKMKSAQGHDTQMLYMQALFNTKLPSIVQHLAPIVKGEVMNHMRSAAMWAISPMVNGNSDMVFELYWPIFTDWSQDLEMRINAYYFIMESHPPISRLLNIYWEMQAEPDNELYHFHYSYLQAMARTTDPCHQIFKLNIAQILKLTRKPNFQGYSTYYQMDYIDKKYKFGGDFSGAFVATDDSRSFSFEINSQMFNVRSNYYSFYLTITGLKETIDKKFHMNLDSTTELFNYNEIWNLIKSIPDMKDVKIQLSFGHHHQVVQTYYYGGSNLKDLTHLFEFFFNNQYTKTKRSIEAHYEMFTQIVHPTEIGLPALMEIMIPVIHHKHIDMKKEAANNLINMHFDNKYHIARHARYGISFYNPIADVWQGVNRYHSYDLVLPMYFDLTINTQQHSVKISMKRHEDHHKDGMGLRSHVTTMVFLKDDLHYDILKKSCSKCEHFVIVTKGDEYRHNYTMYEKEDYNTGYKYLVSVYDSEVKASHGTFYHYLGKLAATYSKNYWTPVGHFMLFLRNWHALLTLQPVAGTHGILFKAVPSTESPVSQIDFTFRVNKELVQQKDEFLPGMKYNTRFTWALKNKEKAIKTWDMNAIIDVNPGHTVENTKIDISRIIPNQKDYKVCLESTKKWTKDGINGHMNIVMGQSTDGKCDKDGATIEVDMVGEQLPQQKVAHHVYDVCQPNTHMLGADYHSMYCAAEHTSVRKYIYDIKTHNVPTEFIKSFYGFFDNFRQVYKPYYRYDEEHSVKVEDDHIKLIVEYTMGLPGHEMNVEVITPHYAHEFTGVPAQGLAYWGFYPDNTHYSRFYMFMHHMGMMRTCIVHHDKVQHGLSYKKHIEAYEIPTEWTMYVGDVEKDAKHGVFLKKIEGTNMIALKTVHDSHTLEIYPEGKHGEHFKILVDGKQVSDAVDYHKEDWFSYMLRPHLHGVVLTTFHFHLHMEHTGDQVVIEIPKVHGVQFYGHCVMTH